MAAPNLGGFKPMPLMNEYNKDTIKDPGMIYIGMTLVIPQ